MYLPIETAHLVLSYLLEQSPPLTDTVTSFLEESPLLAPLVAVTDSVGDHSLLLPYCKVGDKSLYDVLSEYTIMVEMVQDKIKEKGMDVSCMEPVTKVLGEFLKTSDPALSISTPHKLDQAVSDATVSQSNIPIAVPKLNQSTSMQTDGCLGDSSDTPSPKAKHSKPPVKSSKSLSVSFNLRDRLNPVEFNKCSSNHFRNDPTRNSVKSNPPLTRAISNAQAQSYLQHNNQGLSFYPQNSSPHQSSSSKFDPCSPTMKQSKDEVLDFDLMEVEEFKLVIDENSVNDNNPSIETSPQTSSDPKNQPEMSSNALSESASPKQCITIRDSFSLLDGQALDSNNNSNIMYKQPNTIIPIDSDTLIPLSGSFGSIKVEPSEEIVCCPDTVDYIPEVALELCLNPLSIVTLSTPRSLRKSGRLKKVPIDPQKQLNLSLDPTSLPRQSITRSFRKGMTSPEPPTTPRKRRSLNKGMTANKKQKVASKSRQESEKKLRCKVCPGCLRKDCGVCKNCLDKPKFGGPNTRKQACQWKICKASKLGKRFKVNRKRRRTCGKCAGCKMPDCSQCKTCKNKVKVKFGRDGNFKKLCENIGLDYSLFDKRVKINLSRGEVFGFLFKTYNAVR